MSETDLTSRFAARMGALLGPDFPRDIALAVSGGGDSMAMLALAHGWARVYGVRLWVVTVDHGLRPESAGEAVLVGAECAALGHPHATLRWHWDGQGNLQDAGRRARLELIDRWRGGIAHVLFAHTADDVAETYLMRLARGSGVEGLSAIAERRLVVPHGGARTALDPADVTQEIAPPVGAEEPSGFHVIRPLLQEARSDLRHYIKVLQVPFVDDPSNEDARYDRVRTRHVLDALAPVGVTRARVVETATRLRRAREALAARAAQVAGEIVEMPNAGGLPTGDLLFGRDGFEAVERDTQLRLLAAALQWVASETYRPREAPLAALLDRLLGGGGGTLHGCETRAEGAVLRVFREYASIRAVQHPVSATGLFDGRWSVTAPAGPGDTVRALGPDGWAQTPEKPDDAPPFHAARSLPAVFEGARLVACRGLGVGPMHDVAFRPKHATIIRLLLSD